MAQGDGIQGLHAEVHGVHDFERLGIEEDHVSAHRPGDEAVLLVWREPEGADRLPHEPLASVLKAQRVEALPRTWSKPRHGVVLVGVRSEVGRGVARSRQPDIADNLPGVRVVEDEPVVTL